MKSSNRLLFRVLLGLIVPASGCALLSKTEPLDVRYFSPPPATTEGGEAVERSSLRLKLGEVTAASHIDRRIVFRSDAHEVGYYEGLRWTESPEEYLERDLERALFERLGIMRVVSGSAPTLDVELVAFEEVVKPKHIGRVMVRVALLDGRFEHYGRTVVMESPISEDDAITATVDVLSRALASCVERITADVVAQLEHIAAAKATPEPARETEREDKQERPRTEPNPAVSSTSR